MPYDSQLTKLCVNMFTVNDHNLTKHFQYHVCAIIYNLQNCNINLLWVHILTFWLLFSLIFENYLDIKESHITLLDTIIAYFYWWNIVWNYIYLHAFSSGTLLKEL